MVTYTLPTSPQDGGTFAFLYSQWDWCMLSSTRMLMVYMQQNPHYLYGQVIDLNGTATPTYRTPHITGSLPHTSPFIRIKRLDGSRALMLWLNASGYWMARVLTANPDYTVTSGADIQVTQNITNSALAILPVVPNSSLCLLHYYVSSTVAYMVTIGISGTTVSVAAAETAAVSGASLSPVQHPMSDGRIFQAWPQAFTATSPHGTGFRDTAGNFTPLPTPPAVSGARYWAPLRSDRILLFGTSSGSTSFATLYDGTSWGSTFSIPIFNSNGIGVVVLDDYHFMYLHTAASTTASGNLLATVYRLASPTQIITSPKGNITIDSGIYSDSTNKEYAYKISNQTIVLVYRDVLTGPKPNPAIAILSQPAA